MRPKKGATDVKRYDELIEVSARLFFERGFDRTTVRDIAGAAGITSGSIFYHFKTKEEILAAIIEIGMRDGMEEIRRSLGGVTGARPRLAMLIRSHLRALHGPYGHYHHIWLREMRLLPPEMVAGFRRMSGDYRALWRSVLIEAAEAGLIRSDWRVFRKVAVGALNWTTFWVKSPSEDEIARLADVLVATLLNEPGAPALDLPD